MRRFLPLSPDRFFWIPEGVLFRGKHTPASPARITELLPGPGLSPYVRCFWKMEWELGSREVPVFVVPSGCANLVFELGETHGRLRAKAVGVRRNPFSFVISGSGGSLGVQFTPGGFSAFCRGSASQLTDRAVPLEVVFGDRAARFEEIAFGASTFSEKVAAWSVFLAEGLPETPPPELPRLHEILAAVVTDETLRSPSQLLARFPGGSERKLQRLFQEWIGISPMMWVRTCRFQGAAKQILRGEVVNWSALALELGYYDQSHFLNDFKSLTGHRPSDLFLGLSEISKT